MLRMLDRHAVQEMRRAGVSARVIAKQYGVSVRTVRRIGREPPVTDGGEPAARQARGIGRPGGTGGLRGRGAAGGGGGRGVAPRGGGRQARGIGRPGVTVGLRERVAALVGDDREMPPGEIGRRLREEGTPLGLSTLYRVLREVRATLPA